MLENDADMALLGECRTGAGRGFDPVVMLTFGTGIGGAAVLGGSLPAAWRAKHPELGHVPVDPRRTALLLRDERLLSRSPPGLALTDAAACAAA